MMLSFNPSSYDYFTCRKIASSKAAGLKLAFVTNLMNPADYPQKMIRLHAALVIIRHRSYN
jgi:hypothetical protein